MKDYLVASEIDSKAEKALVVLPDIWGQTDYSFLTLKQFTDKFQLPCYMLDYFYALTQKPTKFNPDQDEQKAFELMNTLHGEEFMELFDSAVMDIKSYQSNLKKVYAVGFCFGGRLAYLTGINKLVSKIVSFYGAGAHTPDYYKDKTPLQALCETREADDSLSVLSFYGSQDASIPLSDQEQTESIMKKASINYKAKIYDAAHAYFQPGRPNYNEPAAASSWKDLLAFIGGSDV